MASTFINEIHYDNVGGDVGEAVEIAGVAGTDLTGWSLVFYNGSDSSVYGTLPLSGVIPDQDNGFGTLSFLQAPIQNGAADGLALVNDLGEVVEFLSYEGVITAVDGPAAGTTSIDIGVAESGTTLIGSSLQRTGAGNDSADFSFVAETLNTFGTINTGQSFNALAVAVDDTFSITESEVFNAGSVLVANPTTADSDADSPLVVTQVNGDAANVGTQITLATGALLTLNSDGTFTYDTNGIFDALPDFATSGASTTTYTDSFTYGLNGTGTSPDDTATVQIVINGEDSDGDILGGTSGIDTLIAGAGDDKLVGFAGNDTLRGGDGNDILNGNAGDDTLEGGDGDDVYNFIDAGDTIIENADEGIDLVIATIDNVTLADNVENLQLFSSAAITATGNDLDNEIIGTGADNVISGLDGNDMISGRTGDDTLNGNGGDDTLNGQNGADTLNGGSGMDILSGGAQSDTLNGGDDDDTLNGDTGNDTLNGDAGLDTLNGGNGFDTLNGGDGNDDLFGGNQNDVLDGGDGNDLIAGESGRDIVTGGAGSDTFVFSDGDFASGLQAFNADRITDFNQFDGDIIDLMAVDAVDGGSNNDFDFIGTNVFSGTAGELRYSQGGNAFTLVEGDTNGDSVADFAIRLDGLIELAAGNFDGVSDVFIL